MMHQPDDNDAEPERVSRQAFRRYAAAIRCEPLADGRRDPLTPVGPLSPDLAELDAWARALAHLRAVGLAGLPPANVRRAMAAHVGRYAAVLPRRPAA